jgi:ubiquinone biosynthesis protein
MNEQIGWRGLVERLGNEAPRYAQLLPELPRLMHRALARQARDEPSPLLQQLLQEQRRTRQLLQTVVYGGLGFFAGVVLMLLWSRMPL